MKVGTDGILLGAWASIPLDCERILDIGTGTGLVALMLAQRSNNTLIDALDNNHSSYRLAAGNIINSPWDTRIDVLLKNIQRYAEKTALSYDLIVSNPPYFKTGVARNSARHTTTLSHEELLEAVLKLLTLKGHFCLILPIQEGTAFLDIACINGLFPNKITHVKPTLRKVPNRLLIDFTKEKRDVIEDELVILGENGYSDEFIALTKDFYLKM